MAKPHPLARKTTDELVEYVDTHVRYALEAAQVLYGDDGQLAEDYIRDRLVALHDTAPTLDELRAEVVRADAERAERERAARGAKMARCPGGGAPIARGAMATCFCLASGPVVDRRIPEHKPGVSWGTPTGGNQEPR